MNEIRIRKYNLVLLIGSLDWHNWRHADSNIDASLDYYIYLSEKNGNSSTTVP